MNSKSYNLFFMNFANNARFKIIMALRKKPLNVSQICKETNQEQSRVSHHLKSMSKCNILNVKQQGKQRIYSLNNQTIEPILKLVEKHVTTYCRGCKEREI